MQPELTNETFRGYLLDRPDQVLELVKSLAPEDVSEWSHEQLCYLMDDADYDPAAAARESESGLFLDVHSTLTELRSKMEQGEWAWACSIVITLTKCFGVCQSTKTTGAFLRRPSTWSQLTAAVRLQLFIVACANHIYEF